MTAKTEFTDLEDATDSHALAELDRRWAAIEQGETTVPHDKVERWLRTWGTPEFRAAPPSS